MFYLILSASALVLLSPVSGDWIFFTNTHPVTYPNTSDGHLNECFNSSDCRGSLQCLASRCRCPGGYHYKPSDGLNNCRRNFNLTDSCDYNYECPENSICQKPNNTSLTGLCLCPATHQTVDFRCQPRMCNQTSDCQQNTTDVNQVCQKQRCVCNYGNKVNQSGVCDQFKISILISNSILGVEFFWMACILFCILVMPTILKTLYSGVSLLFGCRRSPRGTRVASNTTSFHGSDRFDRLKESGSFQKLSIKEVSFPGNVLFNPSGSEGKPPSYESATKRS